MYQEKEKLFESNYRKKSYKSRYLKEEFGINKKHFILFFLIIIGLYFFFFLFFSYFIFSKINKIKIYSNDLEERIKKIEEKLNEFNNNNNTNQKRIVNENENQNETEKELIFDEFNHNINEQLIKEQNNFCENENLFYNEKFEEKILKANANFLNLSFDIYVYKKKDVVSDNIIKNKNWEADSTKNLLDALNYYSNLHNIKKEDIYVIDIGANIGWYTLSLGKFGYKILSFEPSEINFYILKKNFCLNKDINITLIKKGLFNEEKKCEYYMSNIDIGDGWVICDKNVTLPKDLVRTGDIILTKLNNYIPFLSKNNIAAIKIDVEGSEGKAIEGGIELITKYHVPFIFLEFTPKSLKLHGTDPKEFLLLFENNGYKFCLNNFFDKNHLSADDIIKKNYGLINLYIVYLQILDTL